MARPPERAPTATKTATKPAAQPRQRRRRSRASNDRGTVFAHGGGRLGQRSQSRFARLCQHGDLVLIPTAHPDSDRRRYRQRVRHNWLPLDFTSVTVVHATTRAAARRRRLTSRVQKAECVWLGGGVQGRLLRRYVGTPIESELHALIDRGGVVGGYSAGTAILTEVMIRHGNPDPAEGHGFGLLPGAIVDQHFVAHHREPRLLQMLERHPELIGFGIDEGTALVVTGRRFEVVGDSVVRRCTSARGCVDLLPGATGSFPT